MMNEHDLKQKQQAPSLRFEFWEPVKRDSPTNLEDFPPADACIRAGGRSAPCWSSGGIPAYITSWILPRMELIEPPAAASRAPARVSLGAGTTSGPTRKDAAPPR